jgi:excisionase family DNA binding protein
MNGSSTSTKHYQPIPQDNRAVRPREAARYLGISRSTLYELVDRGLLEAPFPLGVRAVGWRYSTLHAY